MISKSPVTMLIRILWLTAAFFAVLALASATTDPFSGAILGVDLGPHDIVVTMFEHGNPKIVAEMKGGPEYVRVMEEHFQPSVGLHEHRKIDDEASAQAVFVHALHQARLTAGEKIGRMLGIGAPTYPEGSSWDLAGVISAALQEEMQGAMRCRRSWPSSLTALKTYGPNQCLPRYKAGVHTVPEMEKLLGIEVLYGRILVSLYTVEDDYIVIDGSQVVFDTGGSLSTAVRELTLDVWPAIAAIIVNGDVDDSEADEIKTAVGAVLPDLLDRFQDPMLGYRAVASVGAACLAFELATNDHYRNAQIAALRTRCGNAMWKRDISTRGNAA